MRIYLDTEFTHSGSTDPELISIALVAQDGREFYAELNDFDIDGCSAFVRNEVLPLLRATGAAQYDRAGLKGAILKWLSAFPEPELAVDYDGDWHLLCELLGRELPDAVTVTDIYRQLEPSVLDAYYAKFDVPRHHALHDARANRYACARPSEIR